MNEYHELRARIADFEILLRLKYTYTASQCRKYLVKSTKAAHITLCATDEYVKRELPFCDGAAHEAESICIQREFCRALPKLGAFMLHSSVVECAGEGFAFFGLSGAGKSTHTMLWKELLGEKMRIINGDKPVIRFSGGKAVAYGTPWCGKELWSENASVPLKALCHIVKSKENRIRELSKDEAVRVLMGQVILPAEKEDAERTLELLGALIENVRIYELCCDVSLDAARLSYETMKGEKV